MTLGQIRKMADKLLEHGCGTCGSVPVHLVDQGSNDPGAGILTFNYVKNPYCVDNCISAMGAQNNTLTAGISKRGLNETAPTNGMNSTIVGEAVEKRFAFDKRESNTTEEKLSVPSERSLNTTLLSARDVNKTVFSGRNENVTAPTTTSKDASMIVKDGEKPAAFAMRSYDTTAASTNIEREGELISSVQRKRVKRKLMTRSAKFSDLRVHLGRKGTRDWVGWLLRG